MEDCKAEQERQGQVDQELDKVEKAGDYLTAGIEELETQLYKVLHETVPSPNEEEVTAERTLVPLAHRIRNHHELLHSQGVRIRNILDRLEIR